MTRKARITRRRMSYKATMKVMKGREMDINCYRSTPRKSQMFFDCTGVKIWRYTFHL